MNKTSVQPPKYWLRFFRWFCHPDFLEDIEGDLIERFERRGNTTAPRKANWLFAKDVLSLFRPGIIRPLRSPLTLSFDMYKHYFTIAWRNLKKNRSFSLVAFAAERRTKEIGIRKVLGATVASITYLLSKELITLVFISILIATPLAWWMMNEWLQGFAYRTPLEWWLFGLASIASLLIALFTVSFHAIKAGLSNPITALRSE